MDICGKVKSFHKSFSLIKFALDRLALVYILPHSIVYIIRICGICYG